MNLKIQSECFISAKLSYITLKLLYDISSWHLFHIELLSISTQTIILRLLYGQNVCFINEITARGHPFTYFYFKLNE